MASSIVVNGILFLLISSYSLVVYLGGMIKSGYIGSTLHSVFLNNTLNSSTGLTQWSTDPGPVSVTLYLIILSVNVFNFSVSMLNLISFVTPIVFASTKSLS